jgi:hypothetical protein
MDGDYSWRKVYRSFKDTVYGTLPPAQHTEAQFKVPDWGDKVDFHSIIIIIGKDIYGTYKQVITLET